MDIRKSIPKLFAILAFVLAIAYVLDNVAEGTTRSAGKVIFAAWIFKGCALFIAGSMIFGNGLLVRISPEGLFAPRISDSLIPWRDIASVKVLTNNGSKQLQVQIATGSPSEQAVKTPATLLHAYGSTQGLIGHYIPLSISSSKIADIEVALRNAQNASRATPPRGNPSARAGFGRQPQAARGFGRA